MSCHRGNYDNCVQYSQPITNLVKYLALACETRLHSCATHLNFIQRALARDAFLSLLLDCLQRASTVRHCFLTLLKPSLSKDTFAAGPPS